MRIEGMITEDESIEYFNKVSPHVFPLLKTILGTTNEGLKG